MYDKETTLSTMHRLTFTAVDASISRMVQTKSLGHTPQLLKGINKLSCNNKEIYYVDIGLSDAFSEYRNKYDKSIYQSIEINKNKVKIIK